MNRSDVEAKLKNLGYVCPDVLSNSGNNVYKTYDESSEDPYVSQTYQQYPSYESLYKIDEGAPIDNITSTETKPRKQTRK